MDDENGTTDNPEVAKVIHIVARLYQAQGDRVRTDQQEEALLKEGISLPPKAEALLRDATDLIRRAEIAFEKSLAIAIADVPIYKHWLRHAHGIGPRLSGKLIGGIKRIDRFRTPSALWAYCGYHVKHDVIFTETDANGNPLRMNACRAEWWPEGCKIWSGPHEWKMYPAHAIQHITGYAPKRKRGETANWSQQMRKTGWLLAQSFKKLGGPYRELIYRPYKKRITQRELDRGNVIYECDMKRKRWNPRLIPDGMSTPEPTATRPDWTLGHIDDMAVRYAAKCLLRDLWEAWRDLEGLPTRPHYAVQYLGASQQLSPWEMIGREKPEPAVA